MSYVKVLVGILIITIVNNYGLRAQSCIDNLEKATRAYYNGQFQSVIELLDNCDYSKLEKSSRSDIHELLIKSHLLLEETYKADSLMSSLLVNDPLYKPRAGDILLYQELYGTYKLRNQWNFGLMAGFIVPEFEILKYQSISSVVREPLNYSSTPGFILGLSTEILMFKNLYFNTNVSYETFGYSYSEIILEYQQLDVVEQMEIFNLPLSLRYELPLGKFRPYIRLGIANHFNLKAKLSLDLRAIPSEIPLPYTGIPFKTSGYDISFQRRPVTFNYLFGLGLKRTFGTYQIELAVHYEHGTQNLINPEQRFSDENLLNKYFYVPDDIRLSNMKFSFGIYKSILKPKKR